MAGLSATTTKAQSSETLHQAIVDSLHHCAFVITGAQKLLNAAGTKGMRGKGGGCQTEIRSYKGLILLLHREHGGGASDSAGAEMLQGKERGAVGVREPG